MIQIDTCTTCPICGNGSLSEVRVFNTKINILGLKKYSHTKQICLLKNDNRFLCDYDSDNTKEVIRDHKLNNILGIYE